MGGKGGIEEKKDSGPGAELSEYGSEEEKERKQQRHAGNQKN